MAFPPVFEKLDKTLIILGVLSVICLSPIGLGIALLGLISFIGIPIVIIMGLIPTVFLFLLLVRISQHFLGTGKRFRWVPGLALSILIAVGVLAGVPLIANSQLDYLAAKLASDDIDAIAKPVAINSLAIVYSKAYNRVGICDDLCQQALFSNDVSEITMARISLPVEGLPATTIGIKYWIDQQRKCPDYSNFDGGGRIQLKNEKGERGFFRHSLLFDMKTAQGVCIFHAAATISQSDAVLYTGKIRHGKSAFSAGLNPFADTVGASQLSYYVSNNGKLSLKYRITRGSIQKLWPILAPSFVFGRGFNIHAGLLRRTTYYGRAKRYTEGIKLEPFLKNQLGFKFSSSRESEKSIRNSILVSALDRDGAISASTLRVSNDLFYSIFKNKGVNEKDAAIAMRILSDKRFAVPSYASTFVSRIAKTDKILTEKIAKILFDRLADRLGSAPTEARTKLKLTRLGQSISLLPDNFVMPYGNLLEELSKKPVMRIYAYKALTKLAAFGAEAVPQLIYLIDDANNYKGKKHRHQNSWQHPYLAGLKGFCRMGTKGNAAIPLLFSRLDSGIVVKFGPYWDLTINTLISLGADPADIWTHIQTENKNHTRKRFDAKVRGAQKKVDCSY